MSVIEKYITIREKPGKDVSLFWKLVQIFLYFCSMVLSVIGTWSFSELYICVGFNCPLNANVTFVKKVNALQKDNSNHPLFYDQFHSDWGYMSECNFCEYMLVCSGIYAFVWCVFYMMCGRGGSSSNLPSPWRIVYPSLFFNSLIFVFVLISTMNFKSGIEQFCDNFGINNNVTQCSALAEYDLDEHCSGQSALYYITVYRLCSAFSTTAWALSVILPIMRCTCMVDFEITIVTVFVKKRRDSLNQRDRLSNDEAEHFSVAEDSYPEQVTEIEDLSPDQSESPV